MSNINPKHKALIIMALCLAMLGLQPTKSRAASLAECDYNEDTISIACKNWSIQMRGKFHMDTLFDKTDHPDGIKGASGIDLRRARLGFSGTILTDFAFKTEVDFAGNSTSLKAFYLDYKGSKNLIIRAGHHKPPFGLLALTSSSDINFMERVLHAASRYYGVSLFYRFMNGHIGVGAHGDTSKNATSALSNQQDTDFGLATRVTFAPILNEDSYLHLGGGVHYVKNRYGDIKYESRAPFTKAVFDSKLYSVTAKGADGASSSIDFNTEVAFGYRSFGMQAEFLYSQVGYDSTNNRNNNKILGYYVQVNYWLTGEKNNYDAKNGKLKSIDIAPKHNVMEGGEGAIGAAIRYNAMHLNDFKQGNFRALTATVTWNPIQNIRIMAEWAQVWGDLCNTSVSKSCDEDDDPYVAQMRLQFAF